MRSARRERSLAWRVASASVGAAVIASAAAVAVTSALALRAVEQEERRSLAGAADLLAIEIEENPTPQDLEEEIRELGVRGMRALVVRGRESIGDASIAARPRHGCEDIDAEVRYRVCAPNRALERGTHLWVAAPEHVGTYRASFVVAAIIALALALVLAALGGGAAARWAASPLSRLRGALAGDVADPSSVRLPPASGVIEVDAVADAIETLLGRLDVELSRARRFASDAAHELRTPLTKVIGELELLREAPPPEGALEPELARLHQRVSAMATLVERLLALATPASVRADELVSMIELADTAVEERGAARVQLETIGDDALVQGDPALLASLVENGIDNALKFSTGAVVLRVAAKVDRVLVQIDDEGPGVPSDLRERVFEHFYRDPRARGRAGHGLGLALVDHIARVHGGRAAFVDGAKGARLEIDLPRFATHG